MAMAGADASKTKPGAPQKRSASACRKSLPIGGLFHVIVLLQHLDRSVSLRGTLRRAQTDVAYRRFLRHTLSEELPHFSTVSYNFRHRFTQETIEIMAYL